MRNSSVMGQRTNEFLSEIRRGWSVAWASPEKEFKHADSGDLGEREAAEKRQGRPRRQQWATREMRSPPRSLPAA